MLSRAGLASRRDAEEWIVQGRVTVNGRVINSPALDVTANDVITVDGKPLPPRERTRLFLYHKPRGLMTTHADPEGRPTVFDNLPEGLPRLISIGRLDFNTEGLLLLTNDGGLARALELPDTGWLRRYRVRAHGEVTQAQLDELKKGVEVDGVKYGPIDATLERDQGANVWLVFAIREGKNREVRNVLAHLGLEVNRLIRVSYGPFQLAELGEGEVEEVKTRVLREQLGEKIADTRGRGFQPADAGRALKRLARPKDGRAARQEAVQAGRQERADRRPQGPPRAGAAHRQRGGARAQRGRGQRLRSAAASAARLSRQARPEAEGRVRMSVILSENRRPLFRITLMRVVGGRLKGRNLASPSSRDIRPTADRLRESLFNILIHAYDDPIEDARVLDLFAGTGALGIEAVSRGASVRAVRRQRRRGAGAVAQQCRGAGPRRRDQGVSPRRHQSRPRASDGAVLAGVPRSALPHEARREGAGLVARRRLADVGRAAGGRRSQGGGIRARPKVSRNWSGGCTTIRSLCFCEQAIRRVGKANACHPREGGRVRCGVVPRLLKLRFLR